MIQLIHIRSPEISLTGESWILNSPQSVCQLTERERGMINWRNISKWTSDTSSLRAIKLEESKHADIVGTVLYWTCQSYCHWSRSSLRRLIIYLDLHSYF